jgi:glycosyltransferase involved in cell wall biosynthesis
LKSLPKRQTQMRVTLLQPHTAGREGPDFYHVQVYGLAKHLARQGCDVTVITAGANAGKTVEQRDGYELIRLPARFLPLQQTYIPRLVSEIAETQPDVLQAPELIEMTTLQAGLWARRADVPFVIWQGNYRFSGKLPAVQKAYMRSLGVQTARLARLIIAKNTSVEPFLRKLGVSTQKIEFIPVGIDLETFRSKEAAPISELPAAPFLLNIGQLIPRKNQACLIDALAKLPADIRLLIIGRGPQYEHLMQRADTLGIGNRLTISTEPIVNSDMAQVYRKAYLMVSPSRYEIFGMTLLESLACGLPIIARREGGMADAISDGVSGRLYDGHDVQAIVDEVLRLRNNPDLLMEMRKGAERRAAELDWKVIAPRFMAAYQSARDATRK